jgi:hypothetical protein
VFSAHLVSFMQEHGHPSKPPKWLQDTRSCEYRVASYIQREGFFVTAGGKRISLNEVKKVYGKNSKVYKDDSFLEQLIGQHSPCNDFKDDFDDRKEKTKLAILQDFDTLLLGDVLQSSAKDAESVIGDATFELEKKVEP